mgnify:CR=1 FL=1|jgi:hypothetical protein
MKNILIISGHTDLNDSVANKAIIEETLRLLPHAKVVYLDKLYPDFKIDVKAEQEKLENADIIVLQFPFFWYSMPSIMQRWIEETFKHGWSHGRTGDKLKGKKVIVSLTTGAPASMYRKNEGAEHDMGEYLLPIVATCKLCQMDYLGHVLTGGVSYQTRTDESAIKGIVEKSQEHAKRLVEVIGKLE